MKKYLSPILLVGAIALAGGAYAAIKGSVTEKLGDKEARINMGTQDLNQGDRVRAFYHVCKLGKGGSQIRRYLATVGIEHKSCDKIQLGTGTVTKVIDNDESIVEFDDKFNFNKKAYIEKM